MSTRLERILGIIGEVNRGGYPSVDDLCAVFEMAERTLYDDITFIKDRLGLEIEHSRQYGGYYNANPNKKLPEFELFEAEIMALSMSTDLFESFSGLTFRPELDQAIDKIASRLPELSSEVESLKSNIKFRTGGLTTVKRTLWFDLKQACRKHLKVDIEYHTASTDRIQWRTIDPYMMVAHDGAWYVIGYCNMRNELRMFAVHRIKTHKVTTEKFTPLADFDVQAFVDKAFLLEHGDGEQHIKIKFTPMGARYITERQWHPTQKIDLQSDGSCVLEFTAFNLDEVKRWILRFGSAAEVLEPVELRKRMKDELSNTLKKYGD